jgi:D-aminopeptidase
VNLPVFAVNPSVRSVTSRIPFPINVNRKLFVIWFFTEFVIMKKTHLTLILLLIVCSATAQVERKRAREYGINIGVLSPGALNAITDVPGVGVGHVTLSSGNNIRTGVTAILPHDGNLFQSKVPAGIYVENGFGKLAGATQVVELGNIETPIVLTNTLSVSAAMRGVIEHTLKQNGNENVQSVNAVVGETNDGWLNDIRGMHVTADHVIKAIRSAKPGAIEEGNVGAGTGTICFGFKGGIGTASRVLPKSAGGYTVGVLVQTNFGGVLTIDGAPVGEALKKYFMSESLRDSADGSCMIVIATNAPVDARNLSRLAKRSMLGLARSGGIASNGSGDYAIAFSTYEKNRVPFNTSQGPQEIAVIPNDQMSPLFLAVIEATEEAILNSLFKADGMVGKEGHTVEALPLDKVVEILKHHRLIK